MEKQNKLEVNSDNTKYFLDKGYKWSSDGRYLETGDKRIHMINGFYEFSKVDEFSRRLFIKFITE